MQRGNASKTAQRVAAHRLGFDRVPAPYGDPAADDTLARDVAAGTQVPSSWMHEYLRARTAFFDRLVTGAIDGGMRQIVIGAAGYDGRALRYARPGVRWFEVDYPGTQRDKLERLERLGIGAGHVRFVAADFAADPVAAPLLAAGLDPAGPALFLLEGVAVYLDKDVLERVLAQFRGVTAEGAVLGISMSVNKDGRDQGRGSRFRESVAAMGEPARLVLQPGEPAGLLARAGWQVTEPDADAERPQPAGLLFARASPFRTL